MYHGAQSRMHFDLFWVCFGDAHGHVVTWYHVPCPFIDQQARLLVDHTVR